MGGGGDLHGFPFPGGGAEPILGDNVHVPSTRNLCCYWGVEFRVRIQGRSEVSNTMGCKRKVRVAPSVLFVLSVLLCFLLGYCSMSVLITLFLILCSVKSSSSQRRGPAGVIFFAVIQSFRTPPYVLIFWASSVRPRPPFFDIT